MTLDEVFEELKSEIASIFKSDPISDFCQNHNIELQAIALKNSRMESFDKCVKEILFP